VSSAQRVLDQVQSLAATDALAAEPSLYTGALAAELAPVTSLAELEARDAALVAALAAVDAFAPRVMRIRLDHALAADGAIAPPTRKVFAQTVIRYAGNLGLLGERARDIAARERVADPDAVADAVMAAARATLELHAALQIGVLVLVRDLAADAIADADQRARDRNRPDAERRRWSAARRDLEALAANPPHLLAGPLPARLAALPEQLDEPDAGPPPSLADLIELD
jgi:hypothetical protein